MCLLVGVLDTLRVRVMLCYVRLLPGVVVSCRWQAVSVLVGCCVAMR